MIVKTRASVFEEGEGQFLDIAGFKPKASADPGAPAPEQVKAVSQTAKFSSREPATTTSTKPKPAAKRAPRVHRTGRNVQLNVKVSQETIDEFYALTDAHPGWVLGYTLERALTALKRELETET